jgi:peptide/nickel transport system substrate-binding protein
MRSKLIISFVAAMLCLAGFPAGAQTTLRFAPETLTRILDPHFSTSFQVRDFGYLVFDTLFAVNDRFEPQAQMVDTWTVSPDGLTYTFVLRPGLAWHATRRLRSVDQAVGIARRHGRRTAACHGGYCGH